MFILVIYNLTNIDLNCENFKLLLEKLNFILIDLFNFSDRCYIIFDYNEKYAEKNFINNLIDTIANNYSYYMVYFDKYHFDPENIYIISSNINNINNLFGNSFYYAIKLLMLRLSFYLELGLVYLILNTNYLKKIYYECGCDKIAERYRDELYEVQHGSVDGREYVIVRFYEVDGRSTFSKLFNIIFRELISYLESKV